MKSFENRNDMLKFYSKGGTILEIGVFKGDFFDYMVNNCSYDSMEGVDIFEGSHCSGDHNGNNMHTANLDEEYISLKYRYKDKDNINLYKGRSVEYLSKQEDNKYDIIYIDADHSYQAVKKDLIASYPKIKDKGFIMGHDYEINKKKCFFNHNFGTKRAVEEFCKEYNQEVCAVAMDGCVSFAIQITK
jgi:hypothetical protein